MRRAWLQVAGLVRECRHPFAVAALWCFGHRAASLGRTAGDRSVPPRKRVRVVCVLTADSALGS